MVKELEPEEFVWMRERYNWLCNLIAFHNIKTAEEFYLAFEGKFEGWEFSLYRDKRACCAFFEFKDQEYKIIDDKQEKSCLVSSIVCAQNNYCYHAIYDIFREVELHDDYYKYFGI